MLLNNPIQQIQAPFYTTAYQGPGGIYTEVGWKYGATSLNVVYPPQGVDFYQAIRKEGKPVGSSSCMGPDGIYTTVTFKYGDRTFDLVYPPPTSEKNKQAGRPPIAAQTAYGPGGIYHTSIWEDGAARLALVYPPKDVRLNAMIQGGHLVQASQLLSWEEISFIEMTLRAQYGYFGG